MALDPEIRRMLTQTIYVATPRGFDDEGEAIYGKPVAILCRWEPASSYASGAQGEETLSEFLVTTEHAIGKKDRLWPPGLVPTAAGRHEADARLPQRVDTCIDEDGTVSHYEVSL